MTHYRVDKRLFAIGSEIITAMEYYNKFDGSRKAVEDMLELRRPDDKKRRTSCLFVFEEEVCAKKHWSMMKDGKLYQVAIDKTRVFHRGDMAIMDEMKNLVEAGEDIDVKADAYWRGEVGNTPVVEIMVSSAIVTDIISTSDEERRAHLMERYPCKR
jgi:hypothetical protein